MSLEQLDLVPRERRSRSRAERIPPSAEHIAALPALLPQLRAKAIALSRTDRAHADDLLQDALMRWWERGIRPTSIDEFKHWLGSVIRNLQADYWRGSEADFFLTLPGEREAQLEPVRDDDW